MQLRSSYKEINLNISMTSNKYIHHVQTSLINALSQKSNVALDILKMEGMSGRLTRHLYNNLLSMDDARYLEIGVWLGSSTCAAMCGNRASVVCIDNWSEFGKAKESFMNSFNKYKGQNNAIFIEDDCFNVDVSTLPKFNIYLYDGNHEKEYHYKALSHYYNCLDDIFIYIVDDWNWLHVREGTMDAIRQLNLNILWGREIKTTDDDTHPPWGSPDQLAWHNGCFIAVILKEPRA
jgi:hypothetical protein